LAFWLAGKNLCKNVVSSVHWFMYNVSDTVNHHLFRIVKMSECCRNGEQKSVIVILNESIIKITKLN